ncbi:MAG: AMP-binding protein [Anaerolineae bacterium]|nr:AMP-binding protein [Anaerolineae bacterium]
MSQPTLSLNHRLLAVMDTRADRACFQIKKRGRYQSVHYTTFQKRVFRLLKFFQGQNLQSGERVAIIADNSVDWMVIYVACMLSGLVAVPLRTTLPVETLHTILQETGTCLAVVQEEELVRFISTNNTLPELKTMLVTNSALASPPWILPIEAIFADTLPPPDEIQAFCARAERISPHALAVIKYVPSENGRPVGAMFNHAQLSLTMRHMAHWLNFEEDDVAFTIMQWTESPNLLTALHYFLMGVPNALLESLENLADNMRETSPTVMLDIPYTYEKFYEGFTSWLSEQPEVYQKVVRWALAKGKEFRSAGRNASPELRQEHLRADMTFFSRFKGRLGGRIRVFYSTGGSLSREVNDFYEAIGIPIINVYSLTEAGGFPATSHPQNRRPKSVGRVAPGYEVRFAKDGEILIRGETVMDGFWQAPEQTRRAITAEGWLHSGDIGRIDDDGYLYITDRKRHIMVLSTGRKIIPTVIENALVESEFIAQAAVIAEGKPYVSAMIVPDLNHLMDHFQDDGEQVTTTGHPRVKALLEQIIGQVNRMLDRWEQINEYSLLEQPLSRDTGELTPSMKISRHVVAKRYASQIEAMYPSKLQIEAENISQVQIEPERLRELLEKERILDAWMADAGIGFLFEIAQMRQIDAPSMVHICDAAATIAQMENEEKPLSTALIVGDPARINRILPESQIQLLSHDHIRRMRKTLVTMARMVDGNVLGYVVDKHGYVRGINKLSIPLDEPVNFLLGPQFRHQAAISRQCDAVVFFVPAGGRQVRVFSGGHLIGRYSNGDWSPENMLYVDEVIEEVAQEKQYNINLIRRVLRCAFRMSENNMGAIFIIGNADEVMDHSDSSEISHFALIISTPMLDLSDEELINFAKQDGATVIDVQGKFRGCMVLLRPDAETRAEIGPGKGARHSSAAKMSAEANCLAITVSHDGPITVYDSGKRILSL